MESERVRVRAELVRQDTSLTSWDGEDEEVLLDAVEGEVEVVWFDVGVGAVGVLMPLPAAAVGVDGELLVMPAGMYVGRASPAVGIICSVTVCMPPCTCPSAI